MLELSHEGPEDGPEIEALLDRAFGPDRLSKRSYHYRDGIVPLHALCLVARERGVLVGAIRYWPIRLGDRPALLLGPLAIEPARQGQGIGRALTEASLARAEALGWRLVFLVGDPGYYARYGFAVAPTGIVMPGESPARLQYRTLLGAVLPAEGGILSRAGVEPGEQRLPEAGQALVAGHAGLELAQAGSQGTGHGRVGGELGQRPDQGADGERDRPGLRQAAQGLALDPEPQLLPGVLGREVVAGYPGVGME
ncbi:MAG: GNAT family N-acetyltransferase [Dehalococcoidia bacterium]